MTQLEFAIRIVEIAIAVLLTLMVGDYLGYKVGRRRLALIVGIIALVTIVAFAIYAAIVLA